MLIKRDGLTVGQLASNKDSRCLSSVDFPIDESTRPRAPASTAIYAPFLATLAPRLHCANNVLHKKQATT